MYSSGLNSTTYDSHNDMDRECKKNARKGGGPLLSSPTGERRRFRVVEFMPDEEPNQQL